MVDGIMQLSHVILDEAMFADFISPGLNVVLLTLSPQFRFFHVKQFADLRNGVEFLQFFVINVGEHTGWKPEISMDEILSEVINNWREIEEAR